MSDQKNTTTTRRSVPAPQSQLIARDGKKVQRGDSLNRDDYNASLTQSVPADHAKTAGAPETARRQAKQSRDRSVNLGKGKASTVVTD